MKVDLNNKRCPNKNCDHRAGPLILQAVYKKATIAENIEFWKNSPCSSADNGDIRVDHYGKIDRYECVRCGKVMISKNGKFITGSDKLVVYVASLPDWEDSE